jgi:hypothetical protein
MKKIIGQAFARGNHALTSRFWHRMQGTELPSYHAAFLDRGVALRLEPETQAV